MKIEVDEGVLTVKGERKWEKKEEDKERRYSRVERQYGTFIRRFPLPKVSLALSPLSCPFTSSLTNLL